MPPPPDPVKAVFMAALDADPAGRPAILDELCAGDDALRRRVEAMLRANDRTDLLLDRPAADHLADAPGPPTEGRGAVIAGRYTLREAIGEGGMGSVWLAEQTEPVRRPVAVKLIKAGLDSKEVLARFEAERQALAVMSHPHIAKVLDGGTTAAGRPFFVMEYVPGVPITEYCDAERVDVAGRLALFVQVCEAVQHAHQKGVIHRDLKPSNILVGRIDGRPVPKVIDFGLAKATRQPLTATTLHTGPGLLMGTLQYMSPEQAELDNPDIDTRADVYALGVVLYELLTGSTPVERQQFKKAAWLEMLRLIQQEEPLRPSDRLGGSGSLPSLAAQRNLEPVRLTKLVRGDLDWIVMKALEKDRGRRYDTANGFAADVNRYLCGEPVAAHPPSAAYRLRKFVRRHRPQVVAAGLVLAALVAGIVGTSLGLVAARTERDAKETARREEAGQRALAEGRLAKLETGVEILGSVFRDINPNAEQRGGDPVAVALGKRLERAADQLTGEAVGDPLVVARLQGVLARSLYAVGRYAKAIEVFERAIATRTVAFGEDDVDALHWRMGVAAAALNLGDVSRAITLFEGAVPVLTRQLGPSDPGVLRVRGQHATALVAGRRAAEAVPLLYGVLADYRAAGREDEHDALVARNMLGNAYLTAGDFPRAVAVLEPLVPVCEAKLGIDHPDTLVPQNNLAMGYRQAGDFAKSLALLQRTYEGLLAKLGDDHPNTLAARYNLGAATLDAGRFTDAVAILERLLLVREAKDGPAGQNSLLVRGKLGQAYVSAGQSGRAVPLLEQGLKFALAAQGKGGREVAMIRVNLGQAYTAAGQPARAVPVYEAHLEAVGTQMTPADRIITRISLADALRRTGRFARAAQLHEASVAEAEQKLGADHPTTMKARGNLAVAYRSLGRVADSVPLLKSNVELGVRKLGAGHPDALIFRFNLLAAELMTRTEAADLAATRSALEALVGPAGKAFGPAHPNTLGFIQGLADALEQEKAWDRAFAERQKVVAAERRKPAGPALAVALTKQGQTLAAAGRFADAEPPVREALGIRERAEPEAWETFAIKSLLGEALAGQKRYADAEQLLLDGHRGLKARAAVIPWNRPQPLSRSAERLAQLYEAWGKPAEAAKWRAETENKGEK